MKGWVALIIVAFCCAFVFMLTCQDKEDKPNPAARAPENKDELLPGEVRDPRWPKPIIVSVSDKTCTETTKCPPVDEECGHKNFTVQKDTTYYMTVIYFNGDTATASCRTCGTVYDDKAVVMNSVTACPTGGPWINFARLVPGKTYTLEACLQSCPNTPACKCGENVQSEVIISMRRLFD